ncbi:unnamed protein product [Ixodes persulcatus]
MKNGAGHLQWLSRCDRKNVSCCLLRQNCCFVVADISHIGTTARSRLGGSCQDASELRGLQRTRTGDRRSALYVSARHCIGAGAERLRFALVLSLLRRRSATTRWKCWVMAVAMFDAGDDDGSEPPPCYQDNAVGSRKCRTGHDDGTDNGFMKAGPVRGAWRDVVAPATAPSSSLPS